MVAKDESLVNARVRLPRRPDVPAPYSDEDERYLIECEVATMSFVGKNLPGLRIPRLHAYEGFGSELVFSVGAPYMLSEGFYGNTLQDVEFDMCNLPIATREHIVAQWARAQAEIATLAFPSIGSISSVSALGEPVVGRLASLSSSAAYFGAVADAAICKLEPSDAGVSWAALGAFVLQDIVQDTVLYDDGGERFPQNHMDLGTQNILVDDEFNFLAIIDCEFAQTALWAVNHYLMPFPLVWSDGRIRDILRDPEHLVHGNVKRQEVARRLYVQKFRDAETELEGEGRGLGGSVDGAPSMVFACFASLGRVPEADEGLVREMVRLAFGLEGGRAEEYMRRMRDKAGQTARSGGDMDLYPNGLKN